MDFTFSEAEEGYRSRARAWISAHVPQWWKDADAHEFGDEDAMFDGIRRWHQELYDAGYVGVTWPVEYGGQGIGHVENALLQEELVLAGAPPTTNGLGIGLCGPAIIHHGSEAHKKRFLRPMLRAEEMWCQGYSEPGAGSDLANLRTTAERVGDRYVVNGQKIWTSMAHRADWIFCLVRTDTKAAKHEGIGFLLIDMKTPGIEVAPLVQMTGGHGFSQCFFKDVEVPVANLIGAPTQGWQIANTVLGYERGASTLSRYAGYRREFEQLTEDAPRKRRGIYRQRIAQMAIELEVLGANRCARSGARAGREAGAGVEPAEALLLGDERAPVPAGQRPRGRVRPARAQVAPRARGRALGAAAAPVARPDDLRGHERDPAQHHRRARARATATVAAPGSRSGVARSGSARARAASRSRRAEAADTRPRTAGGSRARRRPRGATRRR
jgi:alkylation response protein AidB-like acyl-CoA dehydrogenase